MDQNKPNVIPHSAQAELNPNPFNPMLIPAQPELNNILIKDLWIEFGLGVMGFNSG